jgi:hypothetical protein
MLETIVRAVFIFFEVLASFCFGGLLSNKVDEHEKRKKGEINLSSFR